MLVLSACGGGGGSPAATRVTSAVSGTPSGSPPGPTRARPTETPTATATNSTPEPLPNTPTYPLETRTGLPGVDAVIAAVVSGDVAAALDLVEFTPQPCQQSPGRPGALVCEPGQTPGTLVPAVDIGQCEGGFRPRSVAEASLRSALTEPPRLHSAYGPSSSDNPRITATAYFLLFAHGDHDETPFQLRLNADARIYSITSRCGSAQVSEFATREVLLPPLGDP